MLPTVPTKMALKPFANNAFQIKMKSENVYPRTTTTTTTTTTTEQSDVTQLNENSKASSVTTSRASNNLSQMKAQNLSGSKRPRTLSLNIVPATTTTTTTTSPNVNCDLTETTNASISPTSSLLESFPSEQFRTHKRLTIGFENVRFCKKIGYFKRETKEILCGVSGNFRSGELTGIVGPSGAGKSTLLNIIAGYTSFDYTGDFTVNGRPRDLKAFKPNVAFITQDTSLQPFLTVKEALEFAANLKVGSHMSQLAKCERINKIMEALGLLEHQDTRTRNLSGGQKKRLAIAVELVSNPPVLVLDEPTSGLDSSSATHLITLLKKLALGGCTIICTIHQPSSLTLRMFDHLYAVAEGECIYAGGVDNLLVFLEDIKLNCPETYNPADYLMEIATHDYGEQNSKLVTLIQNGRNNAYRQSRAARSAQLSAIQKVDHLMSLGLLTPVTAPVLSTPLLAQSLPCQHKQLPPINELSSTFWDSHGLVITKDISKKSSKKFSPTKPAFQLNSSTNQLNLCKQEYVYATTFYQQLNILLLRTFLILWRDNSLTTLRFVIHLVAGLLIGFLFYDIGNDASHALNNFRYVFYTLLFIMYCAFSGILVKFPLEFPIVSREHFNCWYSLRAYYFAITLADIPIQIICTCLFVLPTYFMTGQPLESLRLSSFFLMVFMTALVAQSIGLSVGSAMSLQLGAFFGNFFIFPFVQFSGFFLQEKDAPVYMRWMFDISFLRHSIDGAMLAIFGFDRSRLDCHDMYCHYSRPKTLLKDLGILNANYQMALIFLLGVFVLLRLIAFNIMSLRLRFFR